MHIAYLMKDNTAYESKAKSKTIAGAENEVTQSETCRNSYAIALKNSSSAADTANVPKRVTKPMLEYSTPLTKVTKPMLEYSTPLAEEEAGVREGTAVVDSFRDKEVVNPPDILGAINIVPGNPPERRTFERTDQVDEETDIMVESNNRPPSIEYNVPHAVLVTDDFPEAEVVDKKILRRNIILFCGGTLLLIPIAFSAIMLGSDPLQSLSFSPLTSPPTLSPSTSLSPSTTLSPSAFPSISVMPSVSLIPTTIEAGELGRIIQTKLSASNGIIRQIGSPQNNAFLWILNYVTEIETDLSDEKSLLQLYGLAVFYYSTNGNSWKNSDGWLNISADVCNWYGVQRCIDNQIFEIDLSNNNLRGSITDEIVFLESIESIDLAANGLNKISSKLGLLPDLSVLWLHGNQFIGELPEGINGLINKTYFEFLISNIPVTEATISKNGTSQERAFNFILDGIAQNHNYLTKKELLERYVLATMYYSTNGDEWDVKKNWSSPVHHCDWHWDFVFDDRSYKGGVNCDKEKHTVYLHLGQNNITGPIPNELGSLTKLTALYLVENTLTGEIPTELALLTNIVEISIDYNALTGTIPTEVGLLPSLAYLYISDNSLTGTIPTEIGLLSSLTDFFLLNNNFTETIPSEIGLLSSLTSLDLTNNTLTGTIPREIGLLSSLNEMILSNNTLTGVIPTGIGSMSSLTKLYPSYNTLTGRIPTEIGLLSSLTFLDLTNNTLTGMIPTEIGMLSSLYEIFLSNNTLTGVIPTEMGLMSSLATLYLSYNTLTGAIPTELGLLTQLNYLMNLSNELIGKIPTELGLLSKILRIDLANNTLTGPIPVELGSLPLLYDLFLENNILTGTIPTEIGLLTYLNSLYLYGNKLTGEIPPEVLSLTSLTDLKYNSSN